MEFSSDHHTSSSAGVLRTRAHAAQQRSRFWPRRLFLYFWAATLLLLVPTARVGAPLLVERRVQQVLHRISGQASVKGLESNLWRGALTLHDFHWSNISGMPGLELHADRVLVRTAWTLGNRFAPHQLVRLEGAMLRCPVVPRGAAGGDRAMAQIAALLDQLCPFGAAEIRVDKGQALLVAPQVAPLTFNNVFLALDRRRQTGELAIDGTAEWSGHGPAAVHLDVQGDRLRPTFDLELDVSQIRLAQLPSAWRSILGLPSGRGFLSMYVEGRAADGRYRGLVKRRWRGNAPVVAKSPARRPHGFSAWLGSLFHPKTTPRVPRPVSPLRIVPLRGQFQAPLNTWLALERFMSLAMGQSSHYRAGKPTAG
jgi:hypothetical protein